MHYAELQAQPLKGFLVEFLEDIFAEYLKETLKFPRSYMDDIFTIFFLPKLWGCSQESL